MLLRSVLRLPKVLLYIAAAALHLLVTRPRTLRQRAEWLHGLSARVLKAFGVRLTVEGKVPERGALISNHLGYLDIFTFAALHPVVFCAKAEMEHWPVLGWITKMCGTVFIERGQAEALKRASAGMRAAAEAGVPVVFFPEGTTTNGERMLPFRSGLLSIALAAKEPITAARIQYTLDEANPGAKVEDDVAYWGTVDLRKHIFRFIGLKGVHAHVRIAPGPIAFSGPEIHRKLAAKEARGAVEALRTEAGDGKGAHSVNGVPVSMQGD